MIEWYRSSAGVYKTTQYMRFNVQNIPEPWKQGNLEFAPLCRIGTSCPRLLFEGVVGAASLVLKRFTLVEGMYYRTTQTRWSKVVLPLLQKLKKLERLQDMTDKKEIQKHVIWCNSRPDIYKVLDVLHMDPRFGNGLRLCVGSIERYFDNDGVVCIYVTPHNRLQYGSLQHYQNQKDPVDSYGHLFNSDAWLLSQSGHHGTVVYPEHYMPALGDKTTAVAVKSNNSEVLLLL